MCRQSHDSHMTATWHLVFSRTIYKIGHLVLWQWLRYRGWWGLMGGLWTRPLHACWTPQKEHRVINTTIRCEKQPQDSLHMWEGLGIRQVNKLTPVATHSHWCQTWRSALWRSPWTRDGFQRPIPSTASWDHRFLVDILRGTACGIPSPVARTPGTVPLQGRGTCHRLPAPIVALQRLTKRGEVCVCVCVCVRACAYNYILFSP